MAGSRDFNFCIFIFLICGFLSACSKNESRQSRLDRAMELMDQRKYEAAIDLLEKAIEREDRDPATALLLSQAHLGAAHFELLDIGANIVSTQARQIYIGFDITERCSQEALRSFDEVRFSCLILRMMNFLPDAEDFHFNRARNLLREYYPIAEKSPLEVNFLMTVLEWGSALARGRTLALEASKFAKSDLVHESAQAQDRLFYAISHHLKQIVSELRNGFLRARYSYSKVSRFAHQEEGQLVLEVENSKLIITDSLNPRDLVVFASSVIRDNSDRVNREINTRINANIPYPSQAALADLIRLGILNENPLESQAYVYLFHLERSIENLMGSILASNPADLENKFSNAVWKYPPPLLKNFWESFRESWNAENTLALRDYERATSEEWAALREIYFAWEIFFSQELTPAQGAAILKELESIDENARRELLFPATVELASLIRWKNAILKNLLPALEGIFNGNNANITVLTPEQRLRGMLLIARSKAWIEKNLWTNE